MVELGGFLFKLYMQKWTRYGRATYHFYMLFEIAYTVLLTWFAFAIKGAETFPLKELDVTMALCGERDIHNVGLHNLARVPPSW